MNMSPKISMVTFGDNKINQLPYEFWKLGKNNIIFSFSSHYEMPHMIDLIWFIPKDKGKPFMRFYPTYNGKHIYIHVFYGTKKLLYVFSDLNEILFYTDKEWNIQSSESYHSNGFQMPSPLDPSYIIEIVVRNLTVS
ncbi:hypothetical protein RF11_15511 [Thelohanellus kitauei]|uniref:Uncharacterized protein n=1 Tax=Thelohanellus kitauei TaxID=669202 RepID=A0A0C2MZR6_THEKT|nr:hypothetical protein RF11_15511 [Thelohanellus kitauei]